VKGVSKGVGGRLSFFSTKEETLDKQSYHYSTHLFFINPKLYKITINNNTYNNSIHTQFDLSLKLIHTSIF